MMQLPLDVVKYILSFLSSMERSIDVSVELGLRPHGVRIPRSLSSWRQLDPHFVFFQDKELFAYEMYFRWVPRRQVYSLVYRTAKPLASDWSPWNTKRWKFYIPMYWIHLRLSSTGCL